MQSNSFVYIFHGEGAKFACVAYASLADAETDLFNLKLSGVLTKYPLGMTVFEFAVENGYFAPKGSETPEYVQRFTSASLEHYHFEDGKIV